MKKLFFLAALLFLGGCGMQAQFTIDSADMEKNKMMCRDLCSKKNTVIKFIRASGKVEWPRINVVSIYDKVACECDFGKVQCDK